MKHKNSFFSAISIYAFCFLLSLTSCSKSDNELSDEAIVDNALELLNGEIVFSTITHVNGADMTKLPTGAPAKYLFKHLGADSLIVELKDFKIGNMPFGITFRGAAGFSGLNEWEKDEYKGSGWVKFSGINSNVIIGPKDNGSHYNSESGASVTGFINVESQEVEFVLEYNVMSVRMNTFMQKIDKSRAANYEAEKAQYELDLEAYKKEHGL